MILYGNAWFRTVATPVGGAFNDRDCALNSQHPSRHTGLLVFRGL